MLDLVTREEVRDAPVVEDDGDCLYCECRPAVAFCGRYVGDIPGFIGLTADDDCSDCVRVDETTGCPCCGCSSYQPCRLCEVES